MKRRLPLVLVGLLVAAASGDASELYRCEQPEGSLRFADSPHACRGAVPHALRGRIQQGETSSPPAAPAQGSSPVRDLAALLLGATEVGPGWEVVREVPGDPSRDPDLVDWGVSARLARHYTRQRAGTTEVCSIELWSFRTPGQAAAAEAGFSYPDWQIVREGEILLMARGLRRAQGVAPERGVSAACEGLAQRVRARVAAERS
jgi:hypothetical protein